MDDQLIAALAASDNFTTVTDSDHLAELLGMDAAPAAPAYIEPDTYKGRQQMRVRAPYRVTAWKAAELAEMNPTGIIWERFTKTNGGTVARSRYVADAEGNLHIYAADGSKVLTHPAGRVLHILVK